MAKIAERSGFGQPASRDVGRHLRQVRKQQGLSRTAVARSAGLTRRELAAYERGRLKVPESDLWCLAGSCGVDVAELLPRRDPLQISSDLSTLGVGDTIRRLRGPSEPDGLLREYLSMIYELRNLAPGSRMPLRRPDLVALADALGGTPEAIEARLVELIGASPSEAARLRAMILPPLSLPPRTSPTYDPDPYASLARGEVPPAVEEFFSNVYQPDPFGAQDPFGAAAPDPFGAAPDPEPTAISFTPAPAAAPAPAPEVVASPPAAASVPGPPAFATVAATPHAFETVPPDANAFSVPPPLAPFSPAAPPPAPMSDPSIPVAASTEPIPPRASDAPVDPFGPPAGPGFLTPSNPFAGPVDPSAPALADPFGPPSIADPVAPAPLPPDPFAAPPPTPPVVDEPVTVAASANGHGVVVDDLSGLASPASGIVIDDPVGSPNGNGTSNGDGRGQAGIVVDDPFGPPSPTMPPAPPVHGITVLDAIVVDDPLPHAPPPPPVDVDRLAAGTSIDPMGTPDPVDTIAWNAAIGATPPPVDRAPDPTPRFERASAHWQIGGIFPATSMADDGTLALRRADARWALTDLSAPGDCIIEAAFDFRAGTGLGIVFRASVDDRERITGYSFDVDPIAGGGGYLVRLWEASSQYWRPLAQAPVTDPSHLYGRHVVRMTLRGDHLAVLVDGDPVLEVGALSRITVELGREPCRGDRVGVQAWSTTEATVESFRVASI